MKFVHSKDFCRSNAIKHSVSAFHTSGGVSCSWVTREVKELEPKVSVWIDTYLENKEGTDKKLVIEMSPDEAEQLGNQLLSSAKHSRESAKKI